MKYFLVLVLGVLLFSGCFMSYSEAATSEDVSKFINYYEASDRIYSYSPLSYQVYVGENPFSNYSFKALSIGWRGYIFYGDPTSFLKRAFPNADIIVSYQGYFYIGTRVKPLDK